VIDKPNGSRQILVVDDESIICGVIAKGLAFFRFAHANNGKAALEIIEKARPAAGQKQASELLQQLGFRTRRVPVALWIGARGRRASGPLPAQVLSALAAFPRLRAILHLERFAEAAGTGFPPAALRSQKRCEILC